VTSHDQSPLRAPMTAVHAGAGEGTRPELCGETTAARDRSGRSRVIACPNSADSTREAAANRANACSGG
jgi:hypothetical protein